MGLLLFSPLCGQLLPVNHFTRVSNLQLIGEAGPGGQFTDIRGDTNIGIN